MAALPTDPICPYSFPFIDQYPDDHVRFTRLRYTELMTAGERAIMVFDCPSIEDPNVNKAVAFSMWQLPGTHIKTAQAKTNGPAGHLQRPDASAAQMTAFREAIDAVKAEMFDNRYGEKQLYLGMLACHPDYQGRGAGKILCIWGLSKAKAEDLVLTLFAAPTGRRLYRRLGFRDAGTFHTQVQGEDEYLDTPGMILLPGEIKE